MQMHKLKIDTNLSPVLDPDTFCPMKKMDIELYLFYETQIDGRAWGEKEVARRTEDLINKITKEIREKVDIFVKEVDPFGGWR